MGEIIEKKENFVLIYDDEREVDPFVVEWSYDNGYSFNENNFCECFRTEVEARKFIKENFEETT